MQLAMDTVGLHTCAFIILGTTNITSSCRTTAIISGLLLVFLIFFPFLCNAHLLESWHFLTGNPEGNKVRVCPKRKPCPRGLSPRAESLLTGSQLTKLQRAVRTCGPKFFMTHNTQAINIHYTRNERSAGKIYSGFQLSATEIRTMGAQSALKVRRALGRVSGLRLQTTAIRYNLL